MVRACGRVVISSQNRIELVIVNKQPIFYSAGDGPYYPTMRILLRGNAHFSLLSSSS